VCVCVADQSTRTLHRVNSSLSFESICRCFSASPIIGVSMPSNSFFDSAPEEGNEAGDLFCEGHDV